MIAPLEFFGMNRTRKIQFFAFDRRGKAANKRPKSIAKRHDGAGPKDATVCLPYP
jgi:hypothetical protein